MENKELMKAIEECSKLLLINDYKGFFEYVNESKFKTELIAEFKDEYEEAMDEYGVEEDVNRSNTEETKVEHVNIEHVNIEEIIDLSEQIYELDKDFVEQFAPETQIRDYLNELENVLDEVRKISNYNSDLDEFELKDLISTFLSVVKKIKKHELFDAFEDSFNKTFWDFGFGGEEEVKAIFKRELKELKEKEEASKAEYYFETKDYEKFLEHLDSDEAHYSDYFLSEVGDIDELYDEIKELVEAYKNGIITKEQMQNFEYKKYKEDSRFSSEYKYPKAFDYIIENSNIPLKEEARKLKNGAELTIYSGGKEEDYILPRNEKLDDNNFIYSADKYYILGKDCKDYYIYSGDKGGHILHKVKLKLQNGKEYEGMISDKEIENLENSKVVPLIDGEYDRYFTYSIINLENGNVYEMSEHYLGDVPLSTKLIEGHYADRSDGCINLETMKPVLDRKNKLHSSMVSFDMKNGVFVSVEYDHRNNYCNIGAYTTDGKLIDELKVCDDSIDDIIPMWEENIQIIYEQGKFYYVQNNEKLELDFELFQEVSPM